MQQSPNPNHHQSSNRRILFNLLPAHVATHFLDNQFRSNMVNNRSSFRPSFSLSKIDISTFIKSTFSWNIDAVFSQLDSAKKSLCVEREGWRYTIYTILSVWTAFRVRRHFSGFMFIFFSACKWSPHTNIARHCFCKMQMWWRQKTESARLCEYQDVFNIPNSKQLTFCLKVLLAESEKWRSKKR